MRRAILLGAIVVAVAGLPSSAASGRQKQYVLTALADIGMVYWRYDCVHYRANEWSLGVRIFRDTATTGVTYRAGRFARREHRQTLSLVQATEPGTVHGHVLAAFRRRDCWSYFTPRLTVQLYPR